MFKLFLLILYGILDAKITYDQYLGLKVEIAALISKHNCGPLFVRLAWHDAGTYDSKTNTGGPRAAMRFDDGEWTEKPNLFDNSYFKDLLNKNWDVSISEAGNTQFISNDDTIMLPSDWTLIRNDNTRKYVELYAKDKKAFFNDFSDAWQRLIQSGYNNDVLYEVIPDKDDL